MGHMDVKLLVVIFLHSSTTSLGTLGTRRDNRDDHSLVTYPKDPAAGIMVYRAIDLKAKLPRFVL